MNGNCADQRARQLDAPPSDGKASDLSDTIELAVAAGRLQQQARLLGLDETALYLGLAVRCLDDRLPSPNN